MATKQEALVELYKRGILDERQKELVEELDRRGLIRLKRPDYLKESAAELAQDIGPLESFLIGAGEGMYNVGRGIGLAQPATDAEKAAMEALKEQRPISSTIGQITGEVAPFLIPGTAAARVPSLLGRAAASGTIGATEGGIISAGREGDVEEGILIGGGIGMGAELLFPVLGKLGRKIFSTVTGRPPRGAMLDATGSPTQELQEALNASGLTFDELRAEAQNIVLNARPQSRAEQVARKILFEEEGIPISRGEMTKDFGQLATEQQLLESAQDAAAEPFRQFKLKQSEAIKESLNKVIGPEVTNEETGELIQAALEGRKNLLRTEKNRLYKDVFEKTDNKDGIPILIDNIADVVPDERNLRRLNRVSKGAADDVLDTLGEFGIIPVSEEMAKRGIEPEVLSVGNFEDLRQTLLGIERGDTTNATSVIVRPVIEALDSEIEELSNVVNTEEFSKEIIENLKKARKTTRQLKQEFSPDDLTGRLINVKKDGFTPLVEASKVYDKISARSTPVENVRRIVNSLGKAGDSGQEALASLQTTVLMDLIDAGFGTESRKISNIKTFNPTAFKRRFKNIGQEKIDAIFKNNRKSFQKMRNIDTIASELIPPSGTMPKGSASVVVDLMNKLGITAISSKFPGIGIGIGAIEKLGEPIKTRRFVRESLDDVPEEDRVKYFFDERFPGIASAFGISTILERKEDE